MAMGIIHRRIYAIGKRRLDTGTVHRKIDLRSGAYCLSGKIAGKAHVVANLIGKTEIERSCVRR